MSFLRSFSRRAMLPGVSCLSFLAAGASVDVHAADAAPEVALASPDGADSSSSSMATASLDAVTVYGRSADLIGEATTSSQGRVGARELAERPFLRRGELLEVVPGVVITQHSGGGKANQYFLRGFNLDHGTDFAISVDDMPVNMRTHAHGQGYADINFVIPETVRQVNYAKGPFFAALGDFSAAGAAQYKLFDTLPLGFMTTEIGEDQYARLAVGQSFKTGNVSYTAAAEATYDNGPFTLAENFRRFSALLKRYWQVGDNDFALTALAYDATWRSTDQIPQRAVDSGALDRFGNIDPTDGGKSSRGSLSFDWNAPQPDTSTHASVYAIYYTLNLYSDFTYFLNDPVHGDQFNQADRRFVFGGAIAHESVTDLLNGAQAKHTVGLQFRDDLIHLGLHRTEKRAFLSSIRDDNVNEGSLGAYGKVNTKWLPWLRSELGGRADLYRFDVRSDRPGNTDTRMAGILSPKLGLVLGPWHSTEYYLNAGEGFHSNDARGVTTRIDPVSGEATDRVTPLARIKSVEGGMRTSIVPGLVSTVSVFLMDSSSELVLSGDDGSISPTGPTRRYGVELADFYHATSWLAFEADASFTHARYRDDSSGGPRIPNSIGTVLTGAATVDLPNGFFSSLRMRYFGRQPLIEDGSVMEPSSLVFNFRAGYRRRAWEASVEVLNVLNRKTDDIEYFYTSRLPGEPAEGVDDVHFHPNEPRQLRLTMTRHF